MFRRSFVRQVPKLSGLLSARFGKAKTQDGTDTTQVLPSYEQLYGREYNQQTPPEEAGEIETALVDWMAVQGRHTERVHALKDSLATRQECADDMAIDPFLLRVSFYAALLEGEVLFFTNETEGEPDVPSIRIFSLEGNQVAICLFTSIAKCELFAERVTSTQLATYDSVLVRSEDDTNTINAIGMNGLTSSDVPSSMEGAWLKGRDVLPHCRTDVPGADAKVHVVVNPFSPESVSIPQSHIREMLDGNPFDILKATVEHIFGKFIQEYCPEVRGCTTLLLPYHPLGEEDEDAPPALLLVVDSENMDDTLRALHWGKSASAELDSFVTNFACLHIHPVSDIDPVLLKGVDPFFTA